MNDTPRVNEAILKSNGQWSYALVHVARQLERELDDMTSFRDSETRWAAQYKQERDEAIQERDEARECLREAMQAMIGTLANGNKWPERWRKAAGMEEQQ
jgi:hypothetical protein